MSVLKIDKNTGIFVRNEMKLFSAISVKFGAG